MENKMKVLAISNNNFVIEELPKPNPKSGEVTVKVIASAINAAEQKIVDGQLVGRFLHARTTPLVVGWDFAGTIDELGDDVTGLSKGDAVWGHLAYSSSQKQGAFSEYITVPSNALAVKPENVPFHIAAAAATISMTALQSIRDLGGLKEGKKVLIIGAGGGIGSISVGIAKRLGANVTAVCSTKDVERVKDLGADVVLDRKKEDPFISKSMYDLILDTPAKYSYGKCVNSLYSGGSFVTTLPSGALITGKLRSLFSSRKCHFVQVASKKEDLELVGKWLSDGMNVTIDSRHKVSELGSALKRQVDSNRVGKVVVDVAEGWPL